MYYSIVKCHKISNENVGSLLRIPTEARSDVNIDQYVQYKHSGILKYYQTEVRSIYKALIKCSCKRIT